MSKKYLKFVLALIVVVFVLSTAVFAADVGDEDKDVINSPSFQSGNLIEINKNINGTAFAAGRKIVINSKITGDAFTAGKKIIINGEITGNLYCAGQDVEINGKIAGDIFGAAQTINIKEDSLLQRDALLAAQNIVHSGKIDRKLFAAGESVILNGIIVDDISVEGNNLQIKEKADISGDLKYETPQKAEIEKEANLSGDINWEKKIKEEDNIKDEIITAIKGILAALLVWLVITYWRPQSWKNTADTLRNMPLKTFGAGILGVIAVPLLVLILFVTGIGFPLGVILTFLYVTGIYIAKIIVAVLGAYFLAEKFGWPLIHKGVWFVLLGLIVITLLTKIPYIGLLISIVVMVMGLGSFVLTNIKRA